MAAQNRKQTAPASKLPMPNFDSDSEDEFDQDRRARPSASGSKGKAKVVPMRSVYDDSEDEDEDDEDDEDDEAEEEVPRSRLNGHEGEEDQGTGVAVWEEDDMEGMEEEYTSAEDEEDAGSRDEEDASDEEMSSRGKRAGSSKSQMAKLQKDLEQVPLSLLRRAQSKLQNSKKPTDDSDADSDASGETTTSMSGLSDSAKAKRLNEIKRRLAAMQRVKGKALNVTVSDAESSGSDDGREDTGRDNGWAIRRERKEERMEEKDRQRKREEEKERMKRGDKNAPMVLSAKRMVTRKRNAIEPEKIERRDPRFSSMSAGNTDTNLTANSYSFVPKLIEEEYQNLRSALQLAQKRERTSPRHEKEERTAEREQLEREVNRARTRLDVARKGEREREVMKKVKAEQKERAKDGKGTFHLKRGEKKDLLLKARFEALQAEGGKRAIKKAIEKKQKKVAGKEKKSRPFAKGAFGGGGGGGTEGGGAGADGGPRKRRKVG